MNIYLIVSQVIYGLSLLPWFFVWGLSFMSFDSGFSLPAIIFVAIVSLYPVAVIACSIIAWILKNKSKTRIAAVINLIPSLWIVAVSIIVFVL